MKKRVLATLLTGLLLVGTTATCFANDDGISRSITTTNATASFSHFVSTGGGQSIMVEQQVVQREPLAIPNKYKDKVYTHSNTLVGEVAKVSSSRTVTAGKYIRIDWTRGYVNSVLHSERLLMEVQ